MKFSNYKPSETDFSPEIKALCKRIRQDTKSVDDVISAAAVSLAVMISAIRDLDDGTVATAIHAIKETPGSSNAENLSLAAFVILARTQAKSRANGNISRN